MHAFLLGGAGEVGRHIARSLSVAPEIDRVTIAESDVGRANALVTELRTAATGTVDAVAVDARDASALAEAVRGVGCLVNCTPFPFFDSVIEAAITAGVDYVDFISEPTDEHRSRAAAAGITAISGIGLSPGTSNVLCAHAAASFDSVHEIHISFASFRTIAPSPGLLDTILWELGEDCLTRVYYQDGRFIRAAPLEGSRRVVFPPPVGEQLVYFMPHTEATSLPRSFPEVRFVAVRGTWPPELMRDVAVLNKYGLLADAPVGDGPTTSYQATRQAIWARAGGERASFPVWSTFINVEVLGARDGDVVRREYSVSHEPWGTEAAGATAGIHGAIAVRLLARHRGERQRGDGFVDPEVCFDADEYVAEVLEIPDVHVTWTETSA